jgi:hypothetical protein
LGVLGVAVGDKQGAHDADASWLGSSLGGGFPPLCWASAYITLSC